MNAHSSVLLNEAIEGLAIKPEGIYIDATYGRGGHSQAILAQLNEQGRLMVIDQDVQAIEDAHFRFAHDPRVTIEHAAFSQLQHLVEAKGWQEKVNGVLFDLGVSSPQLDQANRGFSFIKEGPLDMRMDTTKDIDAATWINAARESEIANIIYEYGEERFSRRIAAAIVKYRQQKPIETTTELAAIVAKVCPRYEKNKHPATRTFQAIRIFINAELKEIETALNASLSILAISGRLVVISFHSLEDRLVKKFVHKHNKGDELPTYLPVVQDISKQRLHPIGRAIRPSDEEVSMNVRARSATLRIAEKIR